MSRTQKLTMILLCLNIILCQVNTIICECSSVIQIILSCTQILLQPALICLIIKTPTINLNSLNNSNYE